MDKPLFLGLDIGTSGVRGICIDHSLGIISSAGASTEVVDRDVLRNPLNWKRMLTDVLADIDKQAGLSNIVSVSVDGQSGTVLLCDDDGTLFADTSLLYNDAPRQKTIATLTQRIGHCPATLGRTYELWKQLDQPNDFHAVHQADWIAGLLCGTFDQSDENNTLKMGYSPLNKTWTFDGSKLPFSANALPTVSPPAVFRGYASTQLAKSIGLQPTCHVVSGTTDGTAGFIAASGLNNLSAGTAVTSLGTTLIIKSVSRKTIEDASSGVYSHKLFDLWVAGGASNSGAGVLLNHFTPDQLVNLSASIDPAMESPLHYYPLLIQGERFPVNDPGKVSIVEPRPEDDVAFLAGLFESIARIEKRAYETLERLGAAYPETVITVGGGSCNAVWSDIRARVLGVNVVTAKHPDAAYGAALIAKRGFDDS